MKLFALSDLHLGYEDNRRVIAEIAPHPDDWLILAGDIGETALHLEFAFSVLAPRFRRLVWVPGNHELWTLPSNREEARGRYKYELLVALCRSYNVLTPEDPYPVVTVAEQKVRIAPLFLLYDYSFCPSNIPPEKAEGWALEAGTYCSDEELLHADPYDGIAEWCHARCALTEARLKSCNDGLPLVLVNHFPLREDLVRVAIPRFSIWCGTRLSEDWHVRFNATVVVSGHLHVRSTMHRDGTRFEEVSLGYPTEWRRRSTSPIASMREILPGTPASMVSQTISRLA